jgi:hypothetical protein
MNTFFVRVNPRWRICHQGVVYEAGEVAELPRLMAAEWSGWGSVTPMHQAQPYQGKATDA